MLAFKTLSLWTGLLLLSDSILSVSAYPSSRPGNVLAPRKAKDSEKKHDHHHQSKPKSKPKKSKGKGKKSSSKKSKGSKGTKRSNPVKALRSKATSAKTGGIIGGYYPGYNSKLLAVSDIDWDNVDLMYYFVFTTNSTGMDTDATIGDSASLQNMQQLVEATHAQNKPIVFTIGGWDGGLYFSSLVGSDATRKSFVGQISDFINQYGFDGVDIDWEYPGTQGIGCNNISDSDSKNLLSFFQELRSSIGTNKLIAAAVSPAGFLDANGDATDVSGFGSVVDYLTIMNYDTYGGSSSTTGPNAPLSDACSDTDTKFSAIQAVQTWTSKGFPAERILLGVPGYGYEFQTSSSSLSSTPATSGANSIQSKETSQLYQKKKTGMPQGDETDSQGKDVCGIFEGYTGTFLYKSLNSYGFLSSDGTNGTNGYTRYYDSCSFTPFLFNPKNNSLISYDDSQSLGAKAGFANLAGLAGINFFDLTGPTNDVLAAARTGIQTPNDEAQQAYKIAQAANSSSPGTSAKRAWSPLEMASRQVGGRHVGVSKR